MNEWDNDTYFEIIQSIGQEFNLKSEFNSLHFEHDNNNSSLHLCVKVASENIEMKEDEIDFVSIVRNENIETIKSFLKNGSNPNYRDNTSITALHAAVLARDSKKVSILLEYGAFPDLAEYASGLTALHAAVVIGNKEIVGIMLPYADPNIKIKHDERLDVLGVALNLKNFNEEIVNMLLNLWIVGLS
eukprot:430144_1